MRSFEYLQPRTVPEAIALRQEHGDEAHLLAGGTAMVLLMKQDLVRPSYVVSLRALTTLKGIRSLGDGGIEIGALVTHRQAERSVDIHTYCPALAEAFSRVATVRIRNQATIGGSLVHADPAQDPPPMLLALDAMLVLAGPRGERTVPLDTFFVDYFQTALGPDEVLTAVRLPPLPADTRSVYLKYSPRSADDFATVAVAARLRLGPGNTCQEVRLALGSVDSVPLRVASVERALTGQLLTPRMVHEASRLVSDAVHPIDDQRGSASYKREMACVWTERALTRLLEGAGALPL